MKMRVRYIERNPEQMDIIFNDSDEFWAFYDMRCKFILSLYDNYDTWDREHFKITKKGKPRKYNYPKQLFTEKAKKNQKKNWKKYLKKKLDVSEMKRRKVLQSKLFVKQVGGEEYFILSYDNSISKYIAKPIDYPYAMRLIETGKRLEEENK